MTASLDKVILFVILSTSSTFAEQLKAPSSDVPTAMGRSGAALEANADTKNVSGDLSGFNATTAEIPLKQLSDLAQNPFSEAIGTVRSASGQQVYRMVSPSVVLVATKEGFGSGSLVSSAGDIITNWHVVNGFEYLGVVFKPTMEGKELTRAEIKRGRVVKYDQVADLALIKVSDVPAGRNPVRLADSSEIAVGMDVHAIGHPTGQTWSYTTGVISQYRQGYEWQAEADPIKHKADIIQTQTPVNPGNSGGPLLSDSGNLIGINSFKAGGEGLNFAVSVDDVTRFIARPGNKMAQDPKKSDRECKPKELSRFRTEQNDATVVAVDMFCTGKDTAELVTPDSQGQAVFLRLDRNGDGRADAVIFDLQRRGKWDLSFWDENFTGRWTMVGYHDDGTLIPSRFESYAEFQKRKATR
jgi:S1-C subfamily serine protease